MNKQISEIPPTVIVLAAEPYTSPGVFDNFHDGMYLGGHIRFEAAAQLAATGTVEEMLLVGGYNIDPTQQPFASDKTRDMADFIGKRAAKTRLRQVNSLPCTYHNFVAIARVWEQEASWPERVGVLSSAFHLPRAIEFAKVVMAEFGHESIAFVPIVAEELLGVDIATIIGDHRDEYDERLRRETRGIEQIRDGSYRDSCITKKHELVRPLIERYGDRLLSPRELQTAY